MNYCYFVSFKFTNAETGKENFGNASVILEDKIRNETDVRKLEKNICNSLGHTNITILNIQTMPI